MSKHRLRPNENGARPDHAARRVSELGAHVVPARGLRLGAVGGLSWCPGPRVEGRAYAENELFRKAAPDRHGACS
jgi:hypothetical protein